MICFPEFLTDFFDVTCVELINFFRHFSQCGHNWQLSVFGWGVKTAHA